MAISESDYNTSDFNGHVNIGDYKLHVQLAGRPREDEDPLMTLIHGTAGHLEQYADIIRTLQPTQHLLAYTRRGLGHSDPYPSHSKTTPHPPTLDSIAAEPTTLLTTTGPSPRKSSLATPGAA